MRWIRTALAAAVCCALPASASFFCTLTGTPVLAGLGGLAEPMGDVLLQCSGPAGQTVRLSLSVLLDQRVANLIDFEGGNSGGVSLWLDSAPSPAPLPVTPRLVGNQVFFENILVASNSSGQLALRMTGLLAEAAPTVTASVQIVADTPMLLPVNRTVVARGAPALFATAFPGLACCAGPPLPDEMEWASVLARQPCSAAVRATEGFAGAFRPVTIPGPPDAATRLLIRVTGLPPGSRVLIPEAVAGSSAAFPTRAGAFGTSAHPGAFSLAPSPSLLLSRVAQAERDGSGGFAVFWPVSPTLLTRVSEATVEGEEAWAVYQVMAADPGEAESVEIPLWVFTPTTRPNEAVIVRVMTMLAPLSDRPGSVPGAPVPRYRSMEPQADCSLLGDCDADYFPQFDAVPSQTTEFALQSGGRPKDAYIFVINRGGRFIEWEASARYVSGDGWLTLLGTYGQLQGSFHYKLNPKELPPGEYRAEIVFRQKNSPTGVNREVVIPVTLAVTEGPPPPPPQPPAPPAGPRPAMWAALTVPLGFDGPFANGGLVRLQGVYFAEETTVTIGGLPAEVLSVGPGELLVRIPEGAPRGWAPVIAANGGQQSEPFYIDVLPVAPSIVAVANSDGEANRETTPVPPGGEAVLTVTGIALADEPIWVNVHDRWQPVGRDEAAGPGLHALRITIPDDLPAMQTEVKVCVSGPGVDSICSYPAPIWLGPQP